MDFVGTYYRASASPINPMIVFSVCVLDAPMVLSKGGPEQPVLSMVPWARLLRREKHNDGHNSYRHITYVIDFVHRFALSSFVAEVENFATIAGQRAIEKGVLFQNGHGLVSDLDNWNWSEIQPQ
jgi:hypothetical protein